FQGARFTGTQLQGTVFRNAKLQGATFNRVYAWRAQAPRPGARVIEPETGATYPDPRGCHGRAHQAVSCEWTTAEFKALKKSIEQRVPDDLRNDALQRIERLDPASQSDADEKTSSEGWTAIASGLLPLDQYESGLRTAACATEGAPYVIRRLLED